MRDGMAKALPWSSALAVVASLAVVLTVVATPQGRVSLVGRRLRG